MALKKLYFMGFIQKAHTPLKWHKELFEFAKKLKLKFSVLHLITMQLTFGKIKLSII